jgi:hypothetical protein
MTSAPVQPPSAVAPRRFTVEVDQIGSTEWSALLDTFADANLYQTWAYGELRWGARNCSRLVLRADGEAVAMAQLRIVRPRRFKFGLAHLRWGPLCHKKGGELDPEAARRVAAALHAEYVLRRGLFLRVLPNAFKDTPRSAVLQSTFAQFRSEPFRAGDSYRTIVLDLAPPLETLRKQLDQKWRNQLNRAEKNGLTVVEGDGPEEFAGFWPLYDQMYQRKQFAVSSEVREFEEVQRALPAGQRLRVLRCEQNGVPVAGLVGAAFGDTGVYLLGATSDAGMQAKGSYLLQWRMIQWLKERGIRYYNLGGINPVTNPGVYHFKKGFSGEDVLYMEALTACDNVMSKVFARASVLARGRWRKYVTRLLKRG